jgi:hypothetical protein
MGQFIDFGLAQLSGMIAPDFSDPEQLHILLGDGVYRVDPSLVLTHRLYQEIPDNVDIVTDSGPTFTSGHKAIGEWCGDEGLEW